MIRALKAYAWKARQWRYRRQMLRDAKLSELSKHIARARRAHAPVSHLYAAYQERVHQVLGGALNHQPSRSLSSSLNEGRVET